MSLINRLKHEEDPRISAHQFYSSLVGLALGQVTRAQVESFWNIGTTGADKTELDFIINNYTSAVNKEKYLNALHCVFLLLEATDETGFDMTKGQIQTWLTAAAS